jgi:hypothetical protein
MLHYLDNIVNEFTLACSGDGTPVITMQNMPIEQLDRFVVNYVAWNCIIVSPLNDECRHRPHKIIKVYLFHNFTSSFGSIF